jgi:hypothetical protein
MGCVASCDHRPVVRLGALVVVLAVLAGCSGYVDPRSAPIVFTDEQTGWYLEAHEVCSSSTPEELVVEKNARGTEPQEISTAYSLVYEAKRRVPVFEGCLDALEGRPASPR